MTGLEFINMLSPGQWLLIAAVPPAIIALYFLKLKRAPLEVPSTYLWRRSIEDLHVNSLWQKLRQSLLLWLQLLLVLLAMLALLRPHWQGTKFTESHLIFLIDNSASMSAVDEAPSRLAAAKQQALALVDQMESNEQGMVISFSDTAEVQQQFTDNRRALRSRIETIQPSHRTTSLIEALRLAAALANPGQPATGSDQPAAGTEPAAAEPIPAQLFILSDGKFPNVDGFSVGHLKPVFLPVGKRDAANVAITAFSMRRNETRPDRLQTFAQIENHGPTEKQVAASLYRDGVLADADEVTIPAGGTSGVKFDLEKVASGVLRLEAKTDDALALDDIAFAAINVPRRGRVLLVTPKNEALEWALSTPRAAELAEVKVAPPTILKTPEYLKDAAQGSYDLVIYDRCTPAAMPQSNTLFIGRIPPTTAWKTKEGSPAVAPQIIDVEKTHPLLQLVDLSDVDIAESLVLSPPAASRALVDSTAGPLAAIAPRDGFEDAVIGFEIVSINDKGEQTVNTNWLLRPSFPTFAFNALEYLAGAEQTDAAVSVRPGEPVKLRGLTEVTQLRVRRPGGKIDTVLRGKQNEFAYHQADQAGVYEVLEGDKVTQRFAVNLFSSAESDISPRKDPNIQIGYTQVEAAGKSEKTRTEGWRYLVMLGLIVALAEWWIYNRRVYL